VLPGETLVLEASASGASDFSLEASAGRVGPALSGRWVWKAPDAPGLCSFIVRSADFADSITVTAFVMVPFDSLRGGRLGDYLVGDYPLRPLRDLRIYEPPRGFIPVGEPERGVMLSPHFRLGQFVCKQEARCERYVVLQEKLILKLELILEELNLRGHPARTLHVMSGYRTPHYNRLIGNVEFSRHLWGGAADIFVDRDPADGIMDDLNGDGRVDLGDAGVLYRLIESLHSRPEYEPFIGGLARYGSTLSHGPFVHVDVRGRRTRW
jgi:hypothetical protein